MGLAAGQIGQEHPSQEGCSQGPTLLGSACNQCPILPIITIWLKQQGMHRMLVSDLVQVQSTGSKTKITSWNLIKISLEILNQAFTESFLGCLSACGGFVSICGL